MPRAPPRAMGLAAGVRRVWERRGGIEGLRFVYEPERLRFFQGRFTLL